MATQLTITFDLRDVPYGNQEPLTWGRVRALIERNTPANSDLKVRDGLASGDIDLHTAWGQFRVQVTGSELQQHGEVSPGTLDALDGLGFHGSWEKSAQTPCLW